MHRMTVFSLPLNGPFDSNKEQKGVENPSWHVFKPILTCSALVSAFNNNCVLWNSRTKAEVKGTNRMEFQIKQTPHDKENTPNLQLVP